MTGHIETFQFLGDCDLDASRHGNPPGRVFAIDQHLGVGGSGRNTDRSGVRRRGRIGAHGVGRSDADSADDVGDRLTELTPSEVRLWPVEQKERLVVLIGTQGKFELGPFDALGYAFDNRQHGAPCPLVEQLVCIESGDGREVGLLHNDVADQSERVRCFEPAVGQDE